MGPPALGRAGLLMGSKQAASHAHLVLDARVLALGVLSDDHDIDIIIGGLDTRNGAGGPHIGVQAELLAQRQVEGHVALADGCGQRAFFCWWESASPFSVLPSAREGDTFQGQLGLLHGLNDLAAQQRAEAALLRSGGGHLDCFPREGDLGSSENLDDCLRDLLSDAIARDEGNLANGRLFLDVRRGKGRGFRRLE